MRIVTKRIKVIEMTAEEIRKFHELMERARDGHTSHYAEDRLEDGSYLGVHVVEEAVPNTMPPGVKARRGPFSRDGE